MRSILHHPDHTYLLQIIDIYQHFGKDNEVKQKLDLVNNKTKQKTINNLTFNTNVTKQPKKYKREPY